MKQYATCAQEVADWLDPSGALQRAGLLVPEYTIVECPACGREDTPEVAALGVLGSRLHCKCRACGTMYSRDLAE